MSQNDQGFNKYLNFIIKKQFLNLGTVLSKAEQKEIFGGTMPYGGGSCSACSTNSNCNSGVCANFGGDCSHPCGCGRMCL